MNKIFREALYLCLLIIFMDDILIHSATKEENEKTVKLVLEILQKNNLTVKLSKCEFYKDKLEYLGMIVGKGQVKMDPKKLKVVSEWPVPTKKKELQSFLGFCNFYRRFIQDYSKVTRLLYDLTKLGEWSWNAKAQEAFITLKSLLTAAPILQIPTDEDPFRLECDASDFTLGAVLSQKQEGKWHPISYMSKSLIEAERNYQIYDKEMLAIVQALEEWRHLLKGVNTPVEILTDHKNLEFFSQAQNLSCRQARWALYLSRFTFTLTHRPGTQSGKPDALSRREDHKPMDKDNQNLTLIQPEWIRVFRFVDLDLEEEF